ncbi:MAG: carbamoyl phosphate synthase large subunit, partial [Sulfitobacter sp.]|nr:carbamoyl phosphate synthase large subunit [Sulfitobacter sp.]
GETLSLGRTFKEALQKALRGLETGEAGFGLNPRSAMTPVDSLSRSQIAASLHTPTAHRLLEVGTAYRAGWSTEEINEVTHIDPWFLENMRQLVEFEREMAGALLSRELLTKAKAMGFADTQIALAVGTTPENVREVRKEMGLEPVYK